MGHPLFHSSSIGNKLSLEDPLFHSSVGNELRGKGNEFVQTDFYIFMSANMILSMYRKAIPHLVRSTAQPSLKTDKIY